MLIPDLAELVALRQQKHPPAPNSKFKAADPAFGGNRSLFKGHGLDFSEFREYAAGDDIRSIDWRVTARTGKAHTKLFMEERERSAYVVVDLNSYMRFGTRRTFKNVQAARAAALLVWQANHRHDKTGAIVFGDVPGGIQVLPAKRSRRAIWELLKTLCAPTTAGRRASLADALKHARAVVPNGSSIFVISDFFRWDSALSSGLAAFSPKIELTLVKISDPADWKIPPIHQVAFSSGSGLLCQVDTEDRIGAKVFAERWAQSDAALSETARRCRARVIRISTEDDVAEKLLRESPDTACRRKAP